MCFPCPTWPGLSFHQATEECDSSVHAHLPAARGVSLDVAGQWGWLSTATWIVKKIIISPAGRTHRSTYNIDILSYICIYIYIYIYININIYIYQPPANPAGLPGPEIASSVARSTTKSSSSSSNNSSSNKSSNKSNTATTPTARSQRPERTQGGIEAETFWIWGGFDGRGACTCACACACAVACGLRGVCF